MAPFSDCVNGPTRLKYQQRLVGPQLTSLLRLSRVGDYGGLTCQRRVGRELMLARPPYVRSIRDRHAGEIATDSRFSFTTHS